MESLMRYISRTSRLAYLYRSHCLKDMGLGGEHHPYIIHICRNPGISQEDLARRIFVNKSNVARQLAILERDGFITRSPGTEDKRQSLVYPTDKAYEVLPRVKEVLKAWNEAITENFTSDQKEAVLASLMKILNNAVAVVDNLPAQGGMGPEESL